MGANAANPLVGTRRTVEATSFDYLQKGSIMLHVSKATSLFSHKLTLEMALSSG